MSEQAEVNTQCCNTDNQTCDQNSCSIEKTVVVNENIDLNQDSQTISPNILINNLRSIFSSSKEKFSCDQIQEIMNLLCDLDQEIFTLQSNYSQLNKQNNLVNMINSNVHTIVEKLATQNNQIICNDVCSTSNKQELPNFDDMAETISTMVVQKLQELDDSDQDDSNNEPNTEPTSESTSEPTTTESATTEPTSTSN